VTDDFTQRRQDAKGWKPEMNDSVTFIRHNFDNSVVMHEYCIENEYIAIHFTPEGHVDWEDYSAQAKRAKGFKVAFQALEDLGQHGGLVVAQYDPRYFYVGQVNPGTEIELYNFGREHGQQDIYYKLLKLAKRTAAYSYSRYPLMAAFRPLRATICKMSRYSRGIVHHLWDGTPLTRELHNLHPKMLEQMCEEWLRIDYADEYRIKYELLKTGETLPVIDIWAETWSGHRLFAQVTFAEGNKALSKARELKQYCDESASTMPTIGLFMGPETQQDKVTRLGLKYVSIESVFEQFKATDLYGDMLDKMIGIK
jgi:hypothetical protein